MSEKLANPAPLGLMGFGMTTILLNIHNAGFFPISAMILAMGLCYGGLAQIIAGIIAIFVLAVIVDLIILSVGRLATPWTRAKAPA